MLLLMSDVHGRWYMPHASVIAIRPSQGNPRISFGMKMVVGYARLMTAQITAKGALRGHMGRNLSIEWCQV